MELEYPYQIVTFFNKEPEQNESVYYGTHGWYPQMALKRRFKLNGTTEEQFIEELKSFFVKTNVIKIHTGELIKPERMPVHVIHINNQDEIKKLHEKILNKFGSSMTSRYPDREGKDYYPHVTAEYNGKFVIPVYECTNKTFDLNNVWLLKDVEDENSLAFVKIR
tara:strand:- start:192 stop:686 length:495 start_codon:yes stop_codon:yes gene_type:complete